MRVRMIALALTVPVGIMALFVAGCGGTSGSPSNAVTTHNDVDVAFAQQMIPHHEQAIKMARMASTHAQDPKVKDLAAKIEAAQAPEIQTMSGWLQAWGKPIPTGTPGMMGSMPGMASPMPMPGMSPMPGMMSEHDMAQMGDMHGAQFDQMFLQMMIRHHQGAAEMARAEQAHGTNAKAKSLAKQVDSSQTAEISQMQQMLHAMPSPH